jgi:hypothetical protein
MKRRVGPLAATLIGLALCGPVGGQATIAPSGREIQSSTDAIIDELVSTPNFGVVYIADGAGDGTVLNGNPAAAVKEIVNLRDKAIPLLIRHLDDTRTTSALYKGGNHWANPLAVPVGYLCLDILSQIVGDNRILFVEGQRDCDSDGMGACIQPKYYFDPDAYSVGKGDHLLPSKKVLNVKRNWESARQIGLLKFSFPSWLGRFKSAYSITD